MIQFRAVSRWILSTTLVAGLCGFFAPSTGCTDERFATVETSSAGRGDTASTDARILSPAPGIALLGTGGALLLTSVITGSLALSLNKDLNEDCPGGGCYAPYHDDMDRLDALAAVTDAFIPLGAALIIAGTFTLVMSRRTAKRYGERWGTAVTSVARRLDVTGSGLRWRF